MAVALARLRMPLVYVATALLIVDIFFVRMPGWLMLAMLVLALAVYFRIGTVRRPPVTVACPVRGHWLAVNSPADRVPSHFLHAYGQTYAIDLVHVPEDRRRPGFASWPLTRRPEEFPGFGQPVFAPADGVIVRVHGRARDHRSRTSPLAMLYVVVEGGAREFLGPGRIQGNHVVLRLDDGVYAAFAHLRRGSVRVRRGDRVVAASRSRSAGTPATRRSPISTSS